jgi:hypothetical protein
MGAFTAVYLYAQRVVVASLVCMAYSDQQTSNTTTTAVAGNQHYTRAETISYVTLTRAFPRHNYNLILVGSIDGEKLTTAPSHRQCALLKSSHLRVRTLSQGCRNPDCLVSLENKIKSAPNICGSSVWNLL